MKHGLLPTLGNYDLSFRLDGAADEGFLVPNAAPGTWYVLIYADFLSGGSGDYELAVDFNTGVFITGITPGQVGNAEPAAFVLDGAGFTPSSQVSLLTGETATSVDTLFYVSQERLEAEVDVTALSPGSYALRVQTGPHSNEIEFEITTGGEAVLETNLVLPSVVGYHALATLYVEYANTGEVAMPAPLIEVSAQQNGIRGALLTLDADRLTSGFWTSAIPEGFANSVQFLANGATPGVLQPGESGRVPVYFAGWQRPWDLSYPMINFELGILKEDNPGVIDWPALKDYMRLEGITAEAWTPVFANLQAQTGTTWGDYVGMLNDNARYLSRLGQLVTDISDLLAFEVSQARGLSLGSTLASSVDARIQTPSPALSFTRSFGQDIPSRYALGRLGRGWSDNWDYSLAVAEDGTVIITGPQRSRRVFQPDSRGSAYFAEPGDSGTLRHLGGGAFAVTESNGQVLAFNADGTLNYLEDPHGNRITLTWTGALLTRLTHSAGPYLDLSYAGSRLESVTDSAGRATTFTYDAAGEHLQSATDFRNQTTTYGYGSNASDRHALARVQRPDGTESQYGYDAGGHLASKTGCGGAPGTIHYAYDAGTIRVTDQLGHSSESYLDHRGRLARTVDALGQVTSRTFDDAGNLRQVIDAAGNSRRYGYDDQGNITTETDELGNTTSYRYGALDRMEKLIDANGNLTRYGYEPDGDLASITYADGSIERWSYDASGNRLSWTNRRGQTIGYTNNGVGLMTQRDYPDGAQHTFEYDAQGNLTAYTDPIGRTTREFDANGRLVQITYPGDRWLRYTYDAAGRRASMTDQLGHQTNYHYDAWGRLDSLTDGLSTEIVRYAYDDAGRLTLKTLGNGVYTTYSYDAAGQLLQLANLKPDGSTLSRHAYTYDERGRRITMTTTFGVGDPRTNLAGTWAYDYDATGQLVGWTAPYGRRVEYNYDALGNRLSVLDDGAETAYCVNELNQYTQVGDVAYGYDADGNLTTRSSVAGTTTFRWSADNKLVELNASRGTWSSEYDANGNRLGFADETARALVYDPSGLGNLVAEYSSLGSLDVRYEYSDNLVARLDGSGNRFYYTYDAVGDTSELVDASGGISNVYELELFGELSLIFETVVQPFQFAAEHGIVTDISALKYARTRYFDSGVGRFLSADPIGIDGGINLYSYVSNSPVDSVDASGLTGCSGYKTIGCRGLCARCAKIRLNQGVMPDGAYWECIFALQNNCPAEVDNNGEEAGDAPTCQQVENGTASFSVSRGRSKESGGCQDGSSGNTNPVRPTDPNEKTGPSTYGPNHYIAAGTILPYRIDFENDEEATAPAQIVTITDQLDPRFDWTSFELTEIGFGDERLTVPAGSQRYEGRVAMSYQGVDFEVQVAVGIRSDTGEVYANFYSLDAETGLPPAVDIGFLPPEDGTGRGQGFFSYVIEADEDLPSGTELRNIAYITFDGAETIATNQVDPHDPSKGTDPEMEAPVRLDATLPQSAVDALPAVSTSPVTVSWTGSDPDSGIARYDIYVRDHAIGIWSTWLTGVAATSGLFVGEPGRSYDFYSLAYDNTGNVEAKSPSAEATTLIVVDDDPCLDCLPTRGGWRAILNQQD